MDVNTLEKLLGDVREGKTSVNDAMSRLRELPFEDMGFAKVDHHRHLRQGFPEVIFCEGKTPEDVCHIVEAIARGGCDVLATRASREVFDAVSAKFDRAEYNDRARTIVLRQTKGKPNIGLILIISAGTSDIPVGEEARVTAEIMGNRVKTLYDVGVAGIHRLLQNKEIIHEANVIVVAAGMEGALASVVGGLVSRPVIAVPTSIGYGASFGGIAALLAMLNSCAAGVSVVNIDNGFGAGYVASLINEGSTKKSQK